MGFFRAEKKAEPKKLTPDMAGYRPSKDWWPDLTAYKRAIILQHISLTDVRALLEQYAAIALNPKTVPLSFSYATFPTQPDWVYLEYPYVSEMPHYRNFWHYQNLTLWLSQKAEQEFCLAIPQTPSAPLFLSKRDTQNPAGDSMAGIYADRDFYFIIPEEIFEWDTVPTSAFPYTSYLKEVYDFDTQLLLTIQQCTLQQSTILLTYAEE